jgi:hypothetical protein
MEASTRYYTFLSSCEQLHPPSVLCSLTSRCVQACCRCTGKCGSSSTNRRQLSTRTSSTLRFSSIALSCHLPTRPGAHPHLLLVERQQRLTSQFPSDTIRSLQGRLDSPQAPTEHTDDSPSASPRAIPPPSSATAQVRFMFGSRVWCALAHVFVAQLSKSEMADLLSVVYRVQTYLFDESSQTAQVRTWWSLPHSHHL